MTRNKYKVALSKVSPYQSITHNKVHRYTTWTNGIPVLHTSTVPTNQSLLGDPIVKVGAKWTYGHIAPRHVPTLTCHVGYFFMGILCYGRYFILGILCHWDTYLVAASIIWVETWSCNNLIGEESSRGWLIQKPHERPPHPRPRGGAQDDRPPPRQQTRQEVTTTKKLWLILEGFCYILLLECGHFNY